MLNFLEKNGFPVDLMIDTQQADENNELSGNKYINYVYVKNKKIFEFSTSNYSDRRYFVMGFLRAYDHMKNPKNIEVESNEEVAK